MNSFRGRHREWRIALWLLLWPACAAAQISPGALSQPHSHLEGSEHCLECHSQKKRVDSALCLDCHQLLRRRIESEQGFHAAVTDQGCERCHMEHHGEEFDLIWWGEAGQQAFDHQQAGYPLVGAHERLGCRDCHQRRLVRSPVELRRLGKDLDHTFLGLESDRCQACHQDAHRQQFGERDCESCHDAVRWMPASRFSHSRSAYPLLGRHIDVECVRCHPPVPGEVVTAGERGSRQFVGLRFTSCTHCHRDPHAGRLGQQCGECHTEVGWLSVDHNGFDHNRTRFALQGAHRQARCESCHRRDESTRLVEFEHCTDCHRDVHLGQFRRQPGGGACDDCHDVERFSPSRYDLQAHQLTDYPLEGAHLAVPCNACHSPRDVSEIIRLVGTSGGGGSAGTSIEMVSQYVFSSTQCGDCHVDPHGRAIDEPLKPDHCQSCHRIESWHRVVFDHDRTEYPLTGRHQQVACSACHQAVAGPEETAIPHFGKTSSECNACHRDPHAGQFERAAESGWCDRCHSPATWRELTFDHNRDAAFALDGVHRGVACSGCHPTERHLDADLVRYRPLASECRDCHLSSEVGATAERAQ